jgi:hypothetical protein
MGDFHGCEVIYDFSSPTMPHVQVVHMHNLYFDHNFEKTVRNGAWLRQLIQTWNRCHITCDERYSISQDISASIELMTLYETIMRNMREEEEDIRITVDLYRGFYAMTFKISTGPEIVVMLPVSTSHIQHPVQKAFSELCNTHPVRLVLQNRSPDMMYLDLEGTQMAELPRWMLKWMRESRSHPAKLVMDGSEVSICLDDADARSALRALMTVDLSRRNNNTVLSPSFTPKNCEQVTLYLDTILNCNTHLAVRDGNIVSSYYFSRLSMTLGESAAQNDTRRRYIKKIVKEYHLPDITDDMFDGNKTGLGVLIRSILWYVSMIIHYQSTVNRMLEVYNTPLDLKITLLKRMLESNRNAEREQLSYVDRLTNDNFKTMLTNNMWENKARIIHNMKRIIMKECETYKFYVFIVSPEPTKDDLSSLDQIENHLMKEILTS